jgi:hypothetical protein
VTPYASANLGTHVGDAPDAVAENRRRLHSAVGDAVDGWVWLRQVHGDAVVVVDEASGVPATPPEADAAVTTRPGTALCVQVADCAPIALVGTRVVGVVHAGWPGLEAGVIGRAVDALRAREPSPAPGPVRAVLGPCIHPGRYEFGVDDLARLVERFGPSVATTTDWGTPAFDIPTAVRLELTRAGVDDVLDLEVCTSASPDHFSHRRDGLTGRQAVVAVLEP